MMGAVFIDWADLARAQPTGKFRCSRAECVVLMRAYLAEKLCAHGFPVWVDDDGLQTLEGYAVTLRRHETISTGRWVTYGRSAH